jgi:citrate lyase subunit beta / citryl-CoA lyase
MLRSMLFTPGQRHDMIDKALGSAADAIIVDLEDAVADARKEEARQRLKDHAALAGGAPKPCYVRVNGPDSPWFVDDLVAVRELRVTGVLLPMCEDARQVQTAHDILSTPPRPGEMPHEYEIFPLIETTLGLVRTFEICSASPLVKGIELGSGEYGDLLADMGATWTPDGAALAYPRAHALVAARASGNVVHPLDGVFMDYRNDDGLEQESRLAKTIGYTGKCAIHPRQVEIINRVFSLSDEERAWHERIIAAFRDAEQQGVASVGVDGVMVDYAVAKRSERILAHYGG